MGPVAIATNLSPVILESALHWDMEIKLNPSIHHVLQTYNFNVTVVEIETFVRVDAVVESAITTCAVPVLKINDVLQCIVGQASSTHIRP